MKSLSRFWWLAGIVLFVGLAWIGLTVRLFPNTAENTPAPRPGFLAPDFELSDLQGTAVRLSQLRGQIVLINFWATWCPPCQAEMPALQAIYEEYQSNGFIILGINTTSSEVVSTIPDFVAAHGLTFPILLDPQDKATSAYQITGMPTSFLVGRDGIIQQAIVGPINESVLRSWLSSAQNQAP